MASDHNASPSCHWLFRETVPQKYRGTIITRIIYPATFLKPYLPAMDMTRSKTNIIMPQSGKYRNLSANNVLIGIMFNTGRRLIKYQNKPDAQILLLIIPDRQKYTAAEN